VLYTRLYGLTARGRGYAENRGADARVAVLTSGNGRGDSGDFVS